MLAAMRIQKDGLMRKRNDKYPMKEKVSLWTSLGGLHKQR